jgi:hypothetical protein
MPLAHCLDTSVLLPLYIKRATGHAWIASICEPSNQNILILAEATAAELAAALNQLVRGGTSRKKRCTDALALFWDQVDRGQHAMVPVISSIVRRAGDLCGVHSLKGDTMRYSYRALWLRAKVFALRRRMHRLR